MFKLLYLAALCLLLVKNSHAKMKTGDTLPNMPLQGIINTPKSKLDLKHYWEKGGLLIYFWKTHCQFCVRDLPAMEKNLADSKSNLQILIVNDDTDSTCRRWIKKRALMTGLTTTLPIVSGVPLLNKLLPHESWPHFAWVDNSGVLRHVTMGDPVTAANLGDFSRGIHLQLESKDEEEIRYNPVLPLFFKGFGGDGNEMIRYEVFTRYIKHMAVISGIAVDSTRSIAAILNYPAKWMYQSAYNDYPHNSDDIPDNRTIMDIKDTSKYVYAINGQPQTQNFYCYQRVLPRTDSKTVRKLMQEDMDKYWGLHGRMEKQKRICWVLTAEDTSLIQSTGGRIFYGVDPASFSMSMKNYPMDDFNWRMRKNLLGGLAEPYIDETGFKGRVDIILQDIIYNNPASIQKALAKYKLHLEKKERMIDILIISDH